MKRKVLVDISGQELEIVKVLFMKDNSLSEKELVLQDVFGATKIIMLACGKMVICTDQVN